MTNLTERDRNTGIINLARLQSRNPGWISIGFWTLAWKPVAAPRLFSERYGFQRWITIGPWRVRLARRRANVARVR